LLVDDETIILKPLAELISAFGYETLEASKWSSALKLFRKHKKSLALVIMDFFMEDIEGTEAFNELREIASDVPVVITSGYIQEGRIQKLLENGAVAFLEKPYTFEEVQELLSKFAKR